jgi:hypothetical protein
VGFEPTIPASERAKRVHVLDRAATVTGSDVMYATKNINLAIHECKWQIFQVYLQYPNAVTYLNFQGKQKLLIYFYGGYYGTANLIARSYGCTLD